VASLEEAQARRRRAEFEVGPDVAREDLLGVLAQLREAGLIEVR
jgi:hypothetical protein